MPKAFPYSMKSYQWATTILINGIILLSKCVHIQLLLHSLHSSRKEKEIKVGSDIEVCVYTVF